MYEKNDKKCFEDWSQSYTTVVILKCVRWQTLKIQMKCRKIRHFIGVYNIWVDENDIQRKNDFYLEIINCDPSMCTMDQPKFIISNQKDETTTA